MSPTHPCHHPWGYMACVESLASIVSNLTNSQKQSATATRNTAATKQSAMLQAVFQLETCMSQTGWVVSDGCQMGTQ